MISLNWDVETGFVMISASWLCVLTWVKWSNPNCTCSRTKWQSMSMCLVLSWKVGLEAMCKAVWLSQSNLIAPAETPKSFSSCTSQMTSLVTLAMALYSASVDDCAIVFHFFDFQETRASPRNTQKPEVDFLVSMQFPQSTLENAIKHKLEEDGKNRPCSGAILRYHNKWCTASKWLVHGAETNWLNLFTVKAILVERGWGKTND